MKKKSQFSKAFAVAYRIFNTLTEEHCYSKQYAEEFGLSLSSIRSAVKVLSKNGIVISKRGNSVGGLSKAPGKTVADVFGAFNLPYQEGDTFERQIDDLVSTRFSKGRQCEICGLIDFSIGTNLLCLTCVGLDAPVNSKMRLAKCGHYSTNRYFNCSDCVPELEDNMTPEDWGVGVSL